MKKVKWGILGAADIARSCMIPAMKQSQSTDLYAIASRDGRRAQAVKDQEGFQRAYASYQELLDDAEVEAVYLPLPNSLHKQWTLQAAAAGKHILCEKPLAASQADVVELFDACDRANVILQEGFAYLHSPLIRSIRQHLDAGTIGDPGLIEAVFFSPGYPDDNITVRRDTNGGALFDIGCYNISIMHHLFHRDPVEATAIAHYSHLQTDDFTAARIDFGNGCIGAMMAGIGSPQRADRFLIHGDKGSVEIMLPYNIDGNVAYTIRSFHPEQTGGTVQTVQLKLENNYMLEIEDMNRCIRTGGQPTLGRAFSVRQAGIMDQVLEQIGYWKR